MTGGVDCFALNGAPAATIFDAAVTPPSTVQGVLDYDLTYRDTSSHPLLGRHQFNSSHKTNRLKFPGVGRYEATALGFDGGGRRYGGQNCASSGSRRTAVR